MTVSTTSYASTAGTGGAAYVYISGTIAEVIQELADLGLNAKKVVHYSDDGTNATSLVCMSE